MKLILLIISFIDVILTLNIKDLKHIGKSSNNTDITKILVNNETVLEKRFVNLSFNNENYDKINDNRTLDKIRGTFFEGFYTSFSLNYFAELGDKSFLLIITLYNTYDNAYVLLLICLMAQLSMSFLSVILGSSLEEISPKLNKIMFVIGFLMFTIYAIAFMYDYILSFYEDEDKIEKIEKIDEFDVKDNNNKFDEEAEIKLQEDIENMANFSKISKIKKQDFNIDDRIADTDLENSLFIKKCAKCPNICHHIKTNSIKNHDDSCLSKKIKENLTIENDSLIVKYLKLYGIVFLAEFGDRSSLTTIILTAKFSGSSIFFGNVFAHGLGIISAMVVGFFLKNNIKINIIKLVSSLIFFLFAFEMAYNYFNIKK